MRTLKRNRPRTLSAAAAGLSVLALVPPPTSAGGGAASAGDPANRVLAIEFAGSVLGLRLVRAEIQADLNGDEYVARSLFRTTGLARFFEASQIEAASGGTISTLGLTPYTYAHDDQGEKKRRLVSFDYRVDDVVVHVDPPFGDLGEPPANAAQRREALDPVSAMLAMAMGGGDAPCTRTVPVFDSRLRYDLVFTSLGADVVRTRAYEGPAHKCEVRYTPVAGFDPTDLEEGKEAYETPIYVWLAPLADGVTAPVLATANFRHEFPRLNVRVEALSATLTENAS